jgi:hypothetical protein
MIAMVYILLEKKYEYQEAFGEGLKVINDFHELYKIGRKKLNSHYSR